MSEVLYIDVLKRHRARRNEKEQLYPLFDRMEIEGLDKASCCLCIGSGPGEYDIEFIKRRLHNIKHIVAVDKDERGLKEFERNVEDNFPSSVRCSTFHCLIQNWKFEEADCEKFDVILGFHVFYEIPRSERMPIMDFCLSGWLKPGKFLIFNYITMEEVPGMPTTSILFEKYFPPLDNTKKDIEELGGEILMAEKYRSDFDYREIDFDLLSMFRMYNDKLTEEDLKDMMNMLPDGFGSYIAELCVSRKKSST